MMSPRAVPRDFLESGPHRMRHHHIPKFLLRAWADTSNDDLVEAFRLDLADLPSSRWAPKATGYEDNLYALTQPVVAGVEQQAVETGFLQHVDNSAANVRRKMAATGFTGLTVEGQFSWGFSLSLFHCAHRIPSLTSTRQGPLI